MPLRRHCGDPLDSPQPLGSRWLDLTVSTECKRTRLRARERFRWAVATPYRKRMETPEGPRLRSDEGTPSRSRTLPRWAGEDGLVPRIGKMGRRKVILR